MENLWLKSHHIILNMKVGDFFITGGRNMCVIKRTEKRIFFSNGDCITIRKCDNFYYLSGKNVSQILRDIEGFLVYQKHDVLFPKL
jgi:hypothetical protein